MKPNLLTKLVDPKPPTANSGTAPLKLAPLQTTNGKRDSKERFNILSFLLQTNCHIATAAATTSDASKEKKAKQGQPLAC